MFKKLLTFSTLALGVNLAMAGNAGIMHQAAPSLSNGLYAGLAAGLDASKVHADVSGLTTQKENGTDQSFIANVFGGYAYNITHRFNLAGEAFVQYNNAKAEYAQASATAKNSLDTRYAFGLKFMPGYNFANNVRGFIALGPVWTNYKYHSSTLAVAGGAKSSYTKTRVGLLAGLGIEVALCQSLSMRLEYNHISTQDWKLTAAGVTTDFSPSSNQIMLGVAYHF